jgi:hypothetical protein
MPPPFQKSLRRNSGTGSSNLFYKSATAKFAGEPFDELAPIGLTRFFRFVAATDFPVDLSETKFLQNVFGHFSKQLAEADLL